MGSRVLSGTVKRRGRSKVWFDVRGGKHSVRFGSRPDERSRFDARERYAVEIRRGRSTRDALIRACAYAIERAYGRETDRSGWPDRELRGAFEAYAGNEVVE